MADYLTDDDATDDDEKEAAIKAYVAQGKDHDDQSEAEESNDDQEQDSEPEQQAVASSDSDDNNSDDDQDSSSSDIKNAALMLPAASAANGTATDKEQAIKDYLSKQYAAANDTSGIKAAQAQAAHNNFVANIGDALESLAKSNSMAHGGAGVDAGFYNNIKQQGMQGVEQAQQARQAALQQFAQNNAINREAMQDMLTNGSIQQQQAAMKMQTDMNDPASQQSKNAQSAFSAAFGKMPEVASMDISKMSANDLHAASQELEKKASLDNAKSTKAMQLAYQNSMLKDKKDIKQDQLYTDANNKIVTPRGNTAVQQAQVGVASGQKALDILKQYPNTNTMPPEMVNLFTTEIAKVAAGGTPGEHGTAAVSANTFESAWNKFMEKVGGKPTGAQLGPFISQYKNYLDNMIDTNRKTIGTYEGQVYNGYKKRFTPEQDMQWKMDHPSFFQMQDSDSAASNSSPTEKQQQQASTGIVPAAAHPQASKAETWAKANPNDPRASEILKRIGGMNAGL